MQKIGLKSDLRCINPCKSGVGSYLKKLTSPPKGGGRSGNFRGSKNQKSGKCHELSRKSIHLFLPIPPRGGSRGGGLGGQNFKSPGNVMNCPENQYNLFLPIPPWGGFQGGVWGSKFQKSGKCHELLRKSITIFLPPHQRGSQWELILGGQKIKSPGNLMNCREK